MTTKRARDSASRLRPASASVGAAHTPSRRHDRRSAAGAGRTPEGPQAATGRGRGGDGGWVTASPYHVRARGAAPALRRGPGRPKSGVSRSGRQAGVMHTVTASRGDISAHAPGHPARIRRTSRRASPSAAAAGGAAALADVAAAGRAHLRAAGHAQRCVGGGAGDQLEQLGRGVGLLDRPLRRLGDLLLLGRRLRWLCGGSYGPVGVPNGTA